MVHTNYISKDDYDWPYLQKKNEQNKSQENNIEFII